ncbi:MAG: histidine kinase dimerization/phospho-acceptor domain-containing protein, partial [Pseudomonadota bacterium]
MSLGILNAGAAWRQALRPSAEPAMPDIARQSDVPTVLCRLSGRVIAVNGAMAAAGARGQTLDELLGALVDFDDALIYRLSRAASAMGFALEQVRAPRGESLRYLAAVRVGDDAMLWRVLDDAVIAQAVLPSLADHYEAAPFGYLCFEADGTVSSNIRFRDLFGQETAPVIAAISDEAGEIVEGCHWIPQPDGETIQAQVLVPRLGDAESAREVFFFDAAEAQAAGALVQDDEALPIALMRLSATGEILSMNAQAARLLDNRASVGQPIDEVVTCRGRRLSTVVEVVGQTRETLVETVVGANGQAAIRPLQVSLAPSAGDTGEDDGVVIAVLTDATELELLQDKYAQSQKMEAVGKLAGGVAHDFNNLITAINGHCDLLLIGKDATQPEYSDLMQIRQNANRAAALVRQLLAFSRKQTLNPENLTIGDVISDTLYLLDRLIGDQVKLRLD